MTPLILLSVFVVLSRSESTVSSNYYTIGELCDVPERVHRGCSSVVENVRSPVDCMVKCDSDTSCIGASMDENEQCFIHKECPMISGCTLTNVNHRFGYKYCSHGSWDMSSEQCSCVDGFFGDRCKQCPTKCSDLLSLSYPQGFYRVFLDPDYGGQRPFPTLCNIVPPDFSAVIVMCNQGFENFNRSWTDYVNGFYYDDFNNWLGLYAWHRLSTAAGYQELIFVFKVTSLPGEPNVYREHRGFYVGDESVGYSFAFQGSYSNYARTQLQGASFGDCLGPLQNVPFSTFDSDHDENEQDNCAARAGSAWWYNGCDNPCNALGLGLRYLNSKPQYRVFSLLGEDLNPYSSEQGVFFIYIKND